MSDKLLVSTRKGLFTVARSPRAMGDRGVDFLGDNVSLTLTDPRGGRALRRARPRTFRRQIAPLDRERLGGDLDARISAQARGL